MKRLTLSLVSALALAAATPALAQSINIGHLADYSGGTPDVGQPYGQAIQDTIAWVNKNGGVNGKTINSDFNEYGYQVSRALAAFKKWVGHRQGGRHPGLGHRRHRSPVGMVTKEEIPYYSGSYPPPSPTPRAR